MPDSASTKSTDDKNTSTTDTQATAEPVSRPKEQEPENVDTALAQIQERERESTEVAEREITEALGKEIKVKDHEPEIPADVEEAGVKSPEKEASEVLKKGPTINLPTTEEIYKKGQHTKITSKVTLKKEVWGVSGIVALAIYVGRMIKKATHHGKKYFFRKEK